MLPKLRSQEVVLQAAHSGAEVSRTAAWRRWWEVMTSGSGGRSASTSRTRQGPPGLLAEEDVLILLQHVGAEGRPSHGHTARDVRVARAAQTDVLEECGGQEMS